MRGSHAASPAEAACRRSDLGVDLRTLQPGEARLLERAVNLAADMPTGRYTAFLHLPDPDVRLDGRPEYAIRLANRQMWDEATGYNRLPAEIEVQEEAWLSGHGAYTMVETRRSPGSR